MTLAAVEDDVLGGTEFSFPMLDADVDVEGSKGVGLPNLSVVSVDDGV